MKLRVLLVLGLTVGLITACRKDLNDNDIPTAEIIEPQGQTYTDSISLKLNFTDNKNLLQYRVAFAYTDNIYDNLDTNAIARPFNYIYIDAIDGSSALKQIKVAIPDSALTGNYRVLLNCIDEAGQISKNDTGYFYLINPVDTAAPEITNISPTGGSYFTTDSTIVNALLVDPFKVTFYSVRLTDSTGTVKTSIQSYVNNSGFAIDNVLKWTALPTGNYTINITARDAYFNIRNITIPIYIQ